MECNRKVLRKRKLLMDFMTWLADHLTELLGNNTN